MKQKNKSLKTSTKKGAASIYVVVFVTLLFSVLTVTFVRVILSNSINTENNDLSQSAYDAALSGVEDAKRLIERYSVCKKSNTAECQEYVEKVNQYGKNCDIVKQMVYDIREEDGNTEVLIQENTSGNAGDVEVEDEAYTCVTIDPITTDYRSTLSSANPTRVVQLIAAEDYDIVEISWHSDTNSSERNWSDQGTGKKFNTNDKNITPAILSAEIIYPGGASFTDYDSVPHNTIFMIPDDTQQTKAVITRKNLVENNDQSEPLNSYDPFAVKCDGDTYACSQAIELDNMPANSDADFLVLSLPYGQPDTDFTITLKKKNGKIVRFEQAQYAVDSTGRANDVYRRVEVRVEANDNYFPYPRFAVEISSQDVNTDKLKKNFYVTKNCEIINNGEKKEDCPNSKDIN